MSLVFAAITPHPPTLLPTIGKDKVDALKKTQEALEQIEQDLYIAKPNVIFIISPHTGRFDGSFCVNANMKFHSTFKEFGDLTTSQEWLGIPDMAATIAHKSREESYGMQLISEEELDHGASIPLHFLTSHLPEVRVLPVGYSNLDAKSHIQFGELLKDVIMDSDKRVAVIASGDMAHCHHTEAPGGFHKDAEAFDTQLIELLETRNTVGVSQMDTTMIENADECLYRSVLILLGILKNMDYNFKNYSYETPHGVGYLVGNFAL